MTDLLARLLSKVEVDGIGCWMWTASTRDGYGQIRSGTSVRGAHLVMYEQLVGQVAPGKELDHLCRRRACVNPDHLEPVTRRQNLLRSPITAASLHRAGRDCGVPTCRSCGLSRAA